MATTVDLTFVGKIGAQAREYFFQQVLSWSMAVQLAVIIGALLSARTISRGMRVWLTRQQAQYAGHPEAGADLTILLHVVKIIEALIAFLLVAFAYGIADHFNWQRNELSAAGIMLVALALVRLFTDQMKNRVWAKILAIAIWVYAIFMAFLSLETSAKIM